MNETQIKHLRAERGWNQERLADESGVAVRTVQRLEAGHDASLETLSMVANALGVAVRDLFVSVDQENFSVAVHGLDARIEEQQRARMAARKAYRGWWFLYVAVGLAVTVFAIVWASSITRTSEVVLVAPAYWIGGAFLMGFLQKAVFTPRLDARYPLAAREDHALRHGHRDDDTSRRGQPG